MTTAPVPAQTSTPAPGTPARPMWIWKLFAGAFLLFWIVMAAGFGFWPEIRDQWPIAMVMVVGSLVAGSTPMGGGTVAFPVLVLLFEVPVAAARNFGLAIQALGMTSAMIFVLCRRAPVQINLLWWTAAGSALGVTFGTFVAAPNISDTAVKLVFSCMWMSFAILTLFRNREFCSFAERTPIPGASAMRTGLIAGCFGGIVASMNGVGVEMAIYTALVLLYRRDLQVAILSAVSGMAIASLFGTALHLYIGDFDREVFLKWMAAGPIVIFGAPIGSYLVTVLPRAKTLYFVSALCVLQFVWTMRQAAHKPADWLFTAGALMAAGAALFLMYRSGLSSAIKRKAAG